MKCNPMKTKNIIRNYYYDLREDCKSLSISGLKITYILHLKY